MGKKRQRLVLNFSGLPYADAISYTSPEVKELQRKLLKTGVPAEEQRETMALAKKLIQKALGTYTVRPVSDMIFACDIAFARYFHGLAEEYPVHIECITGVEHTARWEDVRITETKVFPVF